ncbi:MAG: class III cytochrome C family protein [Nitrospirae bacterium]|nr:class III cytochrome C family protein [Nitrospirota bacterium]
MIKTTFIVITLILTVLLLSIFPRQMLSPGNLLKGHRHLDNDCLKCHVLITGSMGEKCVSCHKLSTIGKFLVSGAAVNVNSKPGKAHFHQLFSNGSCSSCHSEHTGKKTDAAPKFSHTLLPVRNIGNCLSCHHKPSDTPHQRHGQNCGQCHDTTGNWRAAKVAHDYFRFDRNHNSDCKTCHQGGNYKEYTCYGCHEHSPSKIQRKHQKEGLYSYQNCAACHPSGNEDDARRTAREKDEDEEDND